MSSIPGRIRIRDPRWREPSGAEAARHRVEGLPGVVAQVSARVGSLLVTYDPARASEAQLLELLDHPVHAPARPLHAWRPLQLGLVSSLALTVAAGFLKLRWLHIAAGAALVGCTLVHVFGSQKRAPGPEGAVS